MTTDNRTGLQLRSTVKKDGFLELSLAEVPIAEPKADEVVVRVEASPINPSDLGLLLGGADMSTAKASGTADRPIVTATIAPEMMRAVAGRVDQSMPVGNEGRGSGGGRGIVARGAGPGREGRGHPRRRDVLAVPRDQGGRLPRAAGRHDPRRGRVVLRQPAHGARHGRDHASRGPQGARAHGGGIEPRPDAGQALQRGRDRPRQHRAQAGPGGAPARDRGEARLQHERSVRSWTT